MKVDPAEILFIREKAPRGMLGILAKNVGMPYAKVRSEFYTLKGEFREDMVLEARRLLKATVGLEFNNNIGA